MRTHLKPIAAVSLVCACSCSSTPKGEALPEAAPKATVTVVHMRQRTMDRRLDLQATSLYLRKNMVSAPIPAFVTAVNVRLGERVAQGQLLFELQTREARALGDRVQLGDSTARQISRIRVSSPSAGIITTLDKQPGDYALEGTTLCTLAESSDLVFQVNAPFEVHDALRPGTACTIQLTDGKVLDGRVATELVAMDRLAQTQVFVVRPVNTAVLPEGLLARVSIVTEQRANAQTLPLACILSDEMLEHQWVMKLLNDSIAVNVPVHVGLRTDSLVEIIDPAFSPSDRVLLEGQYGLPDSALVRINTVLP